MSTQITSPDGLAQAEQKGVFDRHLEYCKDCQQGPASMCNSGALLARHQLDQTNAVRHGQRNPFEALFATIGHNATG